MNLDRFLQKTIIFFFSLLFFVLPLFFTSVNSELFEFNKVILLYVFTLLISSAWFGRMMVQKKLLFKKSFFNLPLILFFFSQVLSTLFSIDRHASFFGYYSRFNGGLLSIFCYLLLFFALINNCEKKNVLKFLKISLVSAFIVSIYGILEHFGHSFSCFIFTGQFDVSCWVQDVKSRVFATLGQPNWLAAYLGLLLPLCLAFSLSNLLYIFLFAVLFACLLFTGSRSGFAGLFLGLAVFWTFTFLDRHSIKKVITKPFVVFFVLLLSLIFIFGSPFTQINKYFSLSSVKSILIKPSDNTEIKTEQGPALEVGGSESGQIRKIVWKGAWEIFKHYPFWGSGTETFAYAYYNFRPAEHNLVSEWDFLYNKAHNEYLNFLATTGAFGLGTYLLFIVSFIVFFLKINNKDSKEKKDKKDLTNSSFFISLALFSGWVCFLVGNFFGFSVVVTSLYFFLIPAFVFVLVKEEKVLISEDKVYFSTFQKFFLILLFVGLAYLLLSIVNLWRADYYYAQGLRLNKQSQYSLAYENLVKANAFNPQEPVFLNEISSSLANLAIISFSKKDATTTGELVNLAIVSSDQAVSISPYNLNIWKTRIKVLYLLSLIDPQYLQTTLDSLQTATKLAPTDPKIVLNTGLVYVKMEQTEKGISLINKSIEMKPNYEEARSNLGLIYESLGENKKAIEQFQYILENIKPNDEELMAKIEKLKR